MTQIAQRLIAVFVGACGLTCGQPELRSGLIESARQEKAASLQPETPPRWQSRIESVERSLPYRLLTGAVDGFGVGVGNLTPGAGFAFGPQYSNGELWGGRLALRLLARASTNQSYLGRLDLSLSSLAGDRVFVDFTTVRRDITQMPYYGAGPDSVKTGRSNYRLEDTNVEIRPGVRVIKGLRASLIGSYLAVNIGPGKASRYISSDQQFRPIDAPGIDRQTGFWRGGGLIEYDWRDNAFDPTSGGSYSAQYVRYLDRGLGAYSFLRLDLDASHYIPLFNRTRVIALRGTSSLTTTGGNQRVPFYLQPALGGPQNLRGYRFNRFYGDNSTTVSAEYRWHVTPTLQLAAFADGGKVFDRWARWNFHDMETDVGFGVRFRGRFRTVFSIDTAFSHEGFQVWFRVNSLL